MICRGKGCAKASGHAGKCGPVAALSNQSVTTSSNQDVTSANLNPVTCNQCVTKDDEIERLRNQIREMESKNVAKPKRDRAEYMRTYRKKPLGIAHG